MTSYFLVHCFEANSNYHRSQRVKILIVVFKWVTMAQSLLVVKQAGAAAFYGASSLLIIMVNKAVLTSYGSVSYTVGLPAVYMVCM